MSLPPMNVKSVEPRNSYLKDSLCFIQGRMRVEARDSINAWPNVDHLEMDPYKCKDVQLCLEFGIRGIEENI